MPITLRSFFANTFLAIMQRIQDQVPEIDYIEADLGQLEGYAVRPAIGQISVLVDFEGWQATAMGENSQSLEGTVVVKLAFAQFGQSSSITELEMRKAALNYYELEQKLQLALQGWSPADLAGHLARVRIDTQNLPGGVRLRTIRYSLAFEDDSATPVWDYIPTPELNALLESLTLSDFSIH